MKTARDGMAGRHRGPRLLRAVSDSLADQCPPPNTEASLIRLQAAARDRGLLGESVALSSVTAAPEGKQARSPHVDLGATVILADPPSSWRRGQRQRARPIVSLAAATVVVVIIVLAALLGPHGQHRTFTLVRPPAASPTPSPSRSAASLSLRAIAGTWTGQISQNSPSGSFTVSVKLTVQARPNRVQVFYSGPFTCSGSLLPLSASNGQVVLNQHIVNGPCQPGTVTLTEQTGRSLKFSFAGQGAPAATGTLTRQKV